MVKAKVIRLLLPLCIVSSACIVSSCCGGGYTYTWQKYKMDGHRTGVTIPFADNVSQALGTVTDSIYTSPDGNRFAKGSATYSVARDMCEVQPQLLRLKTVIGYSPKEMLRYGPECELSDWMVDHLMKDVGRITGKKVDVGIANLGGIRVNMPKGDITIDDIVSMFPFNNYLCYVALKGSDLKVIFDQMARRSVQPVGGVRLVVSDSKVDTLLVGDRPVNPDKTYGVATIDFLLDGGDSLYVAKNARQLIITKTLVVDSMLPYVESYKGRPVEYSKDGRVTVREEKKK